jgi:hypothetical protein
MSGAELGSGVATGVSEMVSVPKIAPIVPGAERESVAGKITSAPPEAVIMLRSGVSMLKTIPVIGPKSSPNDIKSAGEANKGARLAPKLAGPEVSTTVKSVPVRKVDPTKHCI